MSNLLSTCCEYYQLFAVQHLNFVGLNFRCFCRYNGFRENYSTKRPRTHAHTRPESQNLFNENFVDGYPRNLSSTKLRRYTVQLKPQRQGIHIPTDIYSTLHGTYSKIHITNKTYFLTAGHIYNLNYCCGCVRYYIMHMHEPKVSSLLDAFTVM